MTGIEYIDAASIVSSLSVVSAYLSAMVDDSAIYGDRSQHSSAFIALSFVQNSRLVMLSPLVGLSEPVGPTPLTERTSPGTRRRTYASPSLTLYP